MKKIVILFLLSLFLFQACKNEKSPKVEKQSNKILSEERFCYLADVLQSTGKAKAKIDFIEYKNNMDLDSAITASQIIELQNGYSYVNEKIKLEEFEIADSVSIVMQTFSYNEDGNFNYNQKINLSELVKLYTPQNGDRIKFSPFRIKLKNNKIISLTEIYIP